MLDIEKLEKMFIEIEEIANNEKPNEEKLYKKINDIKIYSEEYGVDSYWHLALQNSAPWVSETILPTMIEFFVNANNEEDQAIKETTLLNLKFNMKSTTP